MAVFRDRQLTDSFRKNCRLLDKSGLAVFTIHRRRRIFFHITKFMSFLLLFSIHRPIYLICGAAVCGLSFKIEPTRKLLYSFPIF